MIITQRDNRIMTITKRGNRWYDKNDNSWSTKKLATQYSPTLTDCVCCRDCRDCESCSYCSDCSGCYNCYRCTDCIDCRGFRNCYNVEADTDLTLTDDPLWAEYHRLLVLDYERHQRKF